MSLFFFVQHSIKFWDMNKFHKKIEGLGNLFSPTFFLENCHFKITEKDKQLAKEVLLHYTGILITFIGENKDLITINFELFLFSILKTFNMNHYLLWLGWTQRYTEGSLAELLLPAFRFHVMERVGKRGWRDFSLSIDIDGFRNWKCCQCYNWWHWKSHCHAHRCFLLVRCSQVGTKSP